MIFEKSKILTSPHAFSTRAGGVSYLNHTKSLNLAFERGDAGETVIKNLEIFASAVGFDEKSIVSLPQIHSTLVHKVDASHKGAGYYNRDFDAMDIREGDGYITNIRGVTLGVKSADCVPILFEATDGDGKIIGVGAVHAGWRGTVGKIAEVCVNKLISEYGAKSETIRACIGPCIHKCCFEVGDDVKDAVFAMGEDFWKFCPESGKNDGKYFCDLVSVNRHVLLLAGLLPENIDIIDECTCCHPEKYYSHRYSKGLRGTMLSVISMG